MKRIVHVKPDGNTLYEMPDHIFHWGFERSNVKMTLRGKLTVQDVICSLPDGYRKQVKVTPNYRIEDKLQAKVVQIDESLTDDQYEMIKPLLDARKA